MKKIVMLLVMLLMIGNIYSQGIPFVFDPMGTLAWTPKKISPVAWYDPSDESTVVLTGTTVTNLLDKSGNGWNVSQSVAANRPAYGGVNTINGKNCLYFDGSNDTLANTAFDKLTGTTKRSIFIVVKATTISSPSGAHFFDLGIDSTGRRFSIGKYGIRATGMNKYWNAPTGDPLTTVMMLGLTGTTLATLECWASGVELSQAALVNGTLNTAAAIYLGIGPSGATGGAATIAEVVVFNSYLSTDSRQKMEGYLFHKWGLQANLPTTHPYKNAPPSN